MTHKTMHRRSERSGEALASPSLDLVGPVEIGEVYLFAGKKGRERDRESISRGLSTRGRSSYHGDKPPIFITADRGTGRRYVIPAKATDESTIRLLLADRQQESLTVYTDGFRVYEPLEADDAFDRKYVVRDGESADEEVHVSACESHRGTFKDTLTPYLRAFQLRQELFRKPEQDTLKQAVRVTP